VPFDQATGQEIIAGTYGGSNFHFSLAEKLPSAKTFVEAFEKKYNAKPSGYASYQYNAIKAWQPPSRRLLARSEEIARRSTDEVRLLKRSGFHPRL